MPSNFDQINSYQIKSNLICARDVVGEPVYLAGNSLGGFVSASVASQHSSLCRGVCFLNATPFWAFNPVATVAASGAAAAAADATADAASRAFLEAPQQAVQALTGSSGAVEQQATAQSAATSSSGDGATGNSIPDHAATAGGVSSEDVSASGAESSPSDAGTSPSEAGFSPPISESRPSPGWLPSLGLWWDGALPAPPWAVKLLDLVWTQLQRPETIRRTLSQASHPFPLTPRKTRPWA